MIRLNDYARTLGVCKKTALAHARREGLHVEKRPVRGGWAWFVGAHEADGQRLIDALERASLRAASGHHEIDKHKLSACIEAAEWAVAHGMRRDGKAELIVKLYEVL